MGDARNQVIGEEITLVLRRLPGVVDAKVTLDDSEAISGISLKTDGRRPDKYVVRDVETVLATRFSLDLDRHLIQVEPASLDEKVRSSSRLRIRSLNVVTKGALFDIAVELEHGGRVWEGQKQGGNSRRARLRLSCEAVIDAVTPLFAPSGNVAFEGLTCRNVAGNEVVAVVTSLILNGREETSVGCAFVQRDECKAAIKATLSALNDRLPLMLNSQKL